MHSTQLARQTSPEVVHQEEPGQDEILLSDVGPHCQCVCLILQQRFLRQDHVCLVCIHNDGVRFVEHTQEVTNILSLLHGKVSQTIQNESVIGLNRKFHLEKQPHNRPGATITGYVL